MDRDLRIATADSNLHNATADSDLCSAVVSGTMPLVQTQNNCVGGASVLSLRYYLSLSA